MCPLCLIHSIMGFYNLDIVNLLTKVEKRTIKKSCRSDFLLKFTCLRHTPPWGILDYYTVNENVQYPFSETVSQGNYPINAEIKKLSSLVWC